MVAAAMSALALVAAGCGAESHPNEPRPAAPTRVSVTISEGKITVDPARIGVGPERSQQIPQNREHAQPKIKGDDGPLNVIFVAANTTEGESHLVFKGPREMESDQLPPNTPGTFQADLPAGSYTITASGVPSATPGRLTVGHFRASSENDVLLP